MTYVLFNSLANNHKGEENSRKALEGKISSDSVFEDLTKIVDLKKYLEEKSIEDKVILTGGDGTLNHFVNEIGNLDIKCEIDYCPSGSGNDFYTDVANFEDSRAVRINEFIKDLPIVTVKGKDYRFINGVGFGIDGYCCEKGDEIQRTSTKNVNYASIAIKGMLMFYKSTTATVTVDDNKPVTIKKAWLAPTMKGKYYGGGMKVTPFQDCNSSDKKVSCMVMHGYSRLKTLIIFSKIFKGEHVKYKKNVSIFSGNTIKVEFNSPRSLQIDGETILGVTSYIVHTK